MQKSGLWIQTCERVVGFINDYKVWDFPSISSDSPTELVSVDPVVANEFDHRAISNIQMTEKQEKTQ